MGQLAATLLAELRGAKRVFDVVEIAFPSATLGSVQWARADLSNEERGFYPGRVGSFGEYEIGVDMINLGLETRPKRIEIIDDAAESFSNAAAAGEKLEGSLATFKLGMVAEAGPYADWFTTYSGYLDSYESLGGGRWALNFEPRTSALSSWVGQKLSEQDWSNLPEASVDANVPIVYGLWDSSGGTQQGRVTAILTNAATYEYVIAFGALKSVDVVWSGTTRKTVTTDYAVSYAVKGGKTYTLITFVADQGTAVIKADVHGYETVGDGTGTLIDDPADAIKHLIVNFGFNTPTGTWASDSTAPVNVASFAAAKAWVAGRAGGADYKASRLITEPVVLMNECEDWARDMRIPLHFTWGGTLCAYLDDPHTTAAVSSDWLLRYPEDYAETPQWAWSGDGRVKTVRVAVGDKGTGASAEVVVRDRASISEQEESLTMGWGPAHAR